MVAGRRPGVGVEQSVLRGPRPSVVADEFGSSVVIRAGLTQATGVALFRLVRGAREHGMSIDVRVLDLLAPLGDATIANRPAAKPIDTPSVDQ